MPTIWAAAFWPAWTSSILGRPLLRRSQRTRGKTHNEYDSSDLRDAAGRKADYDSSSPYYGLHFGTGYVWNINDAATLDLYGKYFWTRQQGDSVGLSTGEHLSFDDINSSRLRFGGRFAYILNEHVAPYIGAAWEHEFDGKARATTTLRHRCPEPARQYRHRRTGHLPHASADCP